MSAALKLLLLAAGTLLVSAEPWNNYRSLPDSYRKHIDTALKEANGKFGGNLHVSYESFYSTPQFKDSNWYVHVRLIVTECKKKGFEHRDECVKRKPKTPFINCLVCKKKNGEELTDCVIHAEAETRNAIRDDCSLSSYRFGGAVLNARKSGIDGPKTGCVGCV